MTRGFSSEQLQLCFDNRNLQQDISSRSFDALVPIKLKYFPGAEILGLAQALCTGVIDQGHRIQDNNIVRVDGKLFKFVSCFKSHNNEFVRRFRRFLGR